MGILATQTQTSSTDLASTLAVTLTATAVGSALLLFLELSSGVVATIVDSAGGSLAGGQWVVRNDNVGSGPLACYDRLNNPGGITAVTVTFLSTTGHMCVAEFPQIAAAAFDQTAYAEAGTTTAPSSGNTPATTQPLELVFGFFFTFSSATPAYVAGAGFTALAGTGLIGGMWHSTSNCCFLEVKEVSTTGVQAAIATCSSTYQYAMCVTYKETAAANASQAILQLI